MFYCVFASGWGMAGLCLVWGIKKNRARETFSCCHCQSRNSTGFLKALSKQANVLKADGNRGSAPSATLTLAAASHPYASVPAELEPWQKPSTASPSLLALRLCLEQLLSFFTLSPPERKPWSEISQKQPRGCFLSFLQRRAEEWRCRGKGL